MPPMTFCITPLHTPAAAASGIVLGQHDATRIELTG